MNYEGKLNLFTVPLMLDYHPTGSGFKISAGVAYNGNKATLKAKTSKTVYINNHRYTPTELGEIKSTVKLGNDIAPIISLGYDSSFISDGPLTLNFEAGLMYAGRLTSKNRLLIIKNIYNSSQYYQLELDMIFNF
jgi:hypothetical protein